MKVDFYSCSVDLGAAEQLCLSIRLWPAPSVRVWWRSVFGSGRTRYGVKGMVLPFEDGWME